MLQRFSRASLLTMLVLVFCSAAGGQSGPVDAAAKQSLAVTHDGQHDFDFDEGVWKIHLKRLLHPLTGSTTWVDYDGTSVTRKVWGGRSFLEEFDADGPQGRIEGLNLHLYNPQSRQWSLYWANAKDGTLGQPAVGEFRNGRGEFFSQDTLQGRFILVRYVRCHDTPNTAHFEQSFSDDGGKTWEVNWIADQVRLPDDSR